MSHDVKEIAALTLYTRITLVSENARIVKVNVPRLRKR